MKMRQDDLKLPVWRSDTMSDMKGTVMTISTATHQNPIQNPIDADSEILTVMDVAHFLRVPKSTVYKLARLRQLPGSKVGKHWRFLRRDIREWMQKQSSQSL